MLALVLAAALDAESLMARVATIADATMKIREERQLTYHKKLVKEDESKEWRGWWDATGHYDKLTRQNGKAVNKTAEPSTDLNLSEIMRSRFSFTMANPSEARCPSGHDTAPTEESRRCYVVDFTLKPAAERTNLPSLVDPKADMIVNHLVGTLYVDVEYLFIVHIRGRETGSFGHTNGLATIKKIKLDYHQELFTGVPVLTWSRIEVKYAALGIFAGTDKTYYTYTDYVFAYPPMSQPSPTP